jgi:integrase
LPKLPKGMFRRGSSYYVRRRKGGRDRWVSLGRDYTLACEKLKEPRSESPPLTRITVSAALESWLGAYVATARNPQNQKLARQRVDNFLGRYLGQMLVAKVTADDLRGYRLWLEKRLSRQTVAHVLSDARCFFNWCEDSGLIDKSPIPRRLLPRIKERPPDRLTDAEVEALLAVPEPYRFVVRLGLATGLRWGEMVRTQARDVQDGMLVVGETKSGKVRRVPLPPDLLAEIRQRVGRLLPMRNSSGFTRQVRRYSGVERFHPHQLRHTFACRWLERTHDLAALQQVLGHSSIVTTQRYAGLTDEHVRAQGEKFAALESR